MNLTDESIIYYVQGNTGIRVEPVDQLWSVSTSQLSVALCSDIVDCTLHLLEEWDGRGTL